MLNPLSKNFHFSLFLELHASYSGFWQGRIQVFNLDQPLTSTQKPAVSAGVLIFLPCLLSLCSLPVSPLQRNSGRKRLRFFGIPRKGFLVHIFLSLGFRMLVFGSRDKGALCLLLLKAAGEQMLAGMVLVIRSASTRKDPWLTMFSSALGHNYSVQWREPCQLQTSHIWNWKLFSCVAQGDSEVSRPADSWNVLHPKDLSDDQRNRGGGEIPRKCCGKFIKNSVCVHIHTHSQTDRQILPANYIHSTLYPLPFWNI